MAEGMIVTMPGAIATTVVTILVMASQCVSVNGDICTSTICEYNLDVRRARTMTYSTESKTYNVKLNGTRLQVVENSFHRPQYDDVIGTFVNASDVITADGYERDIITINDQFPGPTIEVMEGSQVVVHVTNSLIMEGLTIHWHGIHQRHTPFMDGAAYVTQCPIPPWQTFTYRFKADPAGTHWYHSHLAHQRLDGLFGMLIVHRKWPTLPEIPLTVMDWLHHDVITVEARNPYSRFRRGSGELLMADPERHFSIDNNELTGLHFYGALINGRGRVSDDVFPLSEFQFKAGSRYRFRVAHTGVEYTLELSLDSHALDIVATDGNDVTPTQVDSIYIMPGETLDFEVSANQRDGSYWLRAFIIREGSGVDPTPDDLEFGVKAIVNYGDTKEAAEPSSDPRQCTLDQPCRIYNCPHNAFPIAYNRTCVSLTDLHSPSRPDSMANAFGLDTPDEEVVEYFYNFGFPIGSAINGRKFLDPRAPLDQGDRDRYVTRCDVTKCDAEGCNCTHIDELPYNKTIQLVIVSFTPGARFMASHNVHLHGHSFAVLALGFAQQNETTGRWLAHNDDVICLGDDQRLCSHQQWKDGRRPSLNTVDPPVKDTVLVPARGYTVIRFRSDNPGFWFFHCHLELHMMEGMSMVFDEAPGRHPAPPTHFPTCSDFDFTSEEFSRYMDADFPVIDPDGNLPDSDPESPIDPEDPSDEDILKRITDMERACNAVGASMICLPNDVAIGLVFAFLVTGAILVFVPMTIYFSCSNRKTS